MRIGREGGHWGSYPVLHIQKYFQRNIGHLPESSAHLFALHDMRGRNPNSYIFGGCHLHHESCWRAQKTN